MGMKLYWVAVKETDHCKIHRILGLSDMTLLGISEKDQDKEYNKSDEPLEAFVTQQGWYFIYGSCGGIASFIEEQLDILSVDTELVSFELTETAMASTARYWRDGEMIWSAHHYGDEGVLHFVGKGDFPDHFTAIKEEVFATQYAAGGINADVDFIIEIPSFFAREVTGYKHDEGFANGDKKIKVRQSVLSRKDFWDLLKRYPHD